MKDFGIFCSRKQHGFCFRVLYFFIRMSFFSKTKIELGTLNFPDIYMPSPIKLADAKTLRDFLGNIKENGGFLDRQISKFRFKI